MAFSKILDIFFPFRVSQPHCGRAGIRAFIFGAKSHLWILGHSDISFEDMLSVVIENLSFNDQDISFFEKFAVEFLGNT